MPRYKMLHGTSSYFLESIKSEGLIPDTKLKFWDNYSNSSLDIPSRKSLSGIYFTSCFNTALSASKNSISKFGGKPLLITATLDSSSAFADEDNIWCWVESSLDFIINKVGFKIHNIDKFLGYIESQEMNHVLHWKRYFSDQLHNNLTNNKFHKPNYNFLFEVFDAAVARRCSHCYNLNKILYCINYKSNNKLFKDPGLLPKDINTKEEYYLQVLDKLTKSYKDSCIKTGTLHSFRIPYILTFTGKNRIIDISILHNEDMALSSI